MGQAGSHPQKCGRSDVTVAQQHWHDYRTESLHPIFRRVGELKPPVLIHLGFRKHGDIRTICARYPQLKLISAHAGFPFYKDLWAYRGACPKLYVGLSSPYIDEALARAAVAAMGSERCLDGTDAPYGFYEADEGYDYRKIKGWIERMPVSAPACEGMLGGTFQEIARLG